MEQLNDLLDRVSRLSESEQNRERQALWQGQLSPTYDSADFFRGIPASGRILCLADVRHGEWSCTIPGFDLQRYYTDPIYYLEGYLRKSLYYAEELRDDRLLPKSIPLFQVTLELTLFGAETHYFQERNPWIAAPVIQDARDLDQLDYPDFYRSGLMPLVHDFYGHMREMVGPAGFYVTFPRWRLGTLGTAMHLRGMEDFLVDLLQDPAFAHRLLTFVAESRRRWETERARFLGEPLPKANLGNDDINCPVLSPGLYKEFGLPYDKLAGSYCGGIRYWHSCGNVTDLLPLLKELAPIDMIELGAWTDLGKLIDTFPGTPLEIYVHPDVGVGSNSASIRDGVLAILNTCRAHEADTAVIRGGGPHWYRVASQAIREYAGR